ncbi:MAG: hypothetical protein QM698_16020 [Micropepsaceae bacterium]
MDRPRRSEPRDGASEHVAITFGATFPAHQTWEWRIGFGTDALCVALDGCEATDGRPELHLTELLRGLEADSIVECQLDNESLSTLAIRVVPAGADRVRVSVWDWCEALPGGLFLDVTVPRAELIAALRQAIATLAQQT